MYVKKMLFVSLLCYHSKLLEEAKCIHDNFEVKVKLKNAILTQKIIKHINN